MVPGRVAPLMVDANAKTAGIVVGGLLLLILLIGAGAYATDYGVEATVTDKGQDSEGCFLIVTTEMGGFDVKRHLSCTKSSAVQRGYFVVYHIRSGTTKVYTSEGGSLIYKG